MILNPSYMDGPDDVFFDNNKSKMVELSCVTSIENQTTKNLLGNCY